MSEHCGRFELKQAKREAFLEAIAIMCPYCKEQSTPAERVVILKQPQFYHGASRIRCYAEPIHRKLAEGK